ncbi:DUF4880 domain-containing protein [Lysobacter pythonis]|uniref:DUF4880 domain-containing protein n=1 Tax=Solilutibacter pythonis TaxID=2483112 RepID=A0A3M2HSU2_9GAMM|nr:FecR domain-containing protein [Lysobacter pythonis]RMH90740.1 DUF4880 domain-containing protein [Lysobacter pythonis]
MDSATDLPQALREAADWLVRLEDDSTGPDELEAHRHWLAAAPANAAAWRRAGALRSLFDTLPPSLGSTALPPAKIDRQRRQWLGTAAALTVAAPLGWLTLRETGALPAGEVIHTAIGEQRDVRLPDGVHLRLNTGTHIEVAYDDQQRLLRLIRGEVMIETAADPMRPARPWRLHTPHGMLHPLGTRFGVRLEDTATRLAVERGEVKAIPARAPQRARIVQAGQEMRFGADGAGASLALAETAFDWLHGRLAAHAMPLEQLTAELARYRRGWLDCDPAIAGILVSGMFQLADIDAALALLADAFPIRIEHRTRWWVRLRPALPLAQ